MSPCDHAGYQICVLDTPADIHELGELLKNQLAIPRLDAMHLAAAAPGVLPMQLSPQAAFRLASELCENGLHTEFVPSSGIPSLHSAELVHHLRCAPEGLGIVESDAVTTRMLPWRRLEMIAVGQVPDGVTRHFPADNLITAGRRAIRSTFETPATPGPELWLVFRDPSEGLRLYHEGANYEYLGERKKTSSTANFRLLVEDLLRYAPDAFQTTATQAWLVNGPLSLFAFNSEQEFERWTVLQLLVRRRMAAREQAWSAEAGEDAGNELPQEGSWIWHCVNCGNVVHTEAGTPQPECCGVPMQNALASVPRCWDAACI